jgi:hypothetical protein
MSRVLVTGGAGFTAWGNPWFPHEPPPSAPCTDFTGIGLPAGEAGLRPRCARHGSMENATTP